MRGLYELPDVPGCRACKFSWANACTGATVESLGSDNLGSREDEEWCGVAEELREEYPGVTEDEGESCGDISVESVQVSEEEDEAGHDGEIQPGCSEGYAE